MTAPAMVELKVREKPMEEITGICAADRRADGFEVEGGAQATAGRRSAAAETRYYACKGEARMGADGGN